MHQVVMQCGSTGGEWNMAALAEISFCCREVLTSHDLETAIHKEPLRLICARMLVVGSYLNRSKEPLVWHL